MLATIKKFITGIFSTTYAKADIQKELVLARTILAELIIPKLTEVEELVNAKGISESSKDSLFKLFKNMGVPTTSHISDSVSVLVSFAKELEESITKIDKYVDSKLQDFITDKTMTAKEAGVIGTVNNISSISGYMSDLTLLMTYAINDEKIDQNFILKRTIKSVNSFKTLFSTYYNNTAKVIKSIDKLSNVKVYNEAEFKITAGFGDKKFKLPVNNFVLNPIYHIRKLIVDLQIEYYDYLKYKKELIELKLKEKQMEEPSPALEKQIKYYEEKLASLEYKIKKIEESADD